MSAPMFQPFPMLPGRRAQAWRHQPEFRRPRHFHEEPELNLVLRGSARLGVGDREMALGAGEFVVFQPGQDHVLLDAGPDLDLFVVALTPELASSAGISLAHASNRTGRLSPAEAGLFGERLEAASAARDAAAVEGNLAELFRSALPHVEGTHVLSRRTLERVRAELGVAASEVAAALGNAPSSVSRRFHQDWGLTLVDYRARLRLMRFIELVDGGSSLSRAALQADFGSYAQCHRVFRRFLGCSPSEYFAGARTAIDRAMF